MLPSRPTVGICTVILSADAALADMPQSFGVLEFGPDNTLFVAEATSGTIQAIELPSGGAATEEDRPYNLLDMDALIARALGAEGRILYGDLAVHPVTRDAYVSVTATLGGVETSAIVSVTRAGEVERLDLSALPSTSHVLNDTADTSVTFWRDIPAPTLTVTDLDYADGELFVSGISTGEFASTLRRVPWGFGGDRSCQVRSSQDRADLVRHRFGGGFGKDLCRPGRQIPGRRHGSLNCNSAIGLGA